MPGSASASVAQVVQGIERTSRKTRRPKHSWNVSHKPFTIQPFCIAPVIPGETLTMAMYQARAVTHPVKNPLIGWWMEYYWFYVKLRDLKDRDAITELMLDPAANLTALQTAAKTDTYHYASSVDWTQLCLERVVEEYFRDENEDYAGDGGLGVIDGMPIAKAVPPKANWLDSLMLHSDTRTGNDLQVPDNNQDYTQYQEAYDRMRAMKMVDMTFDDWLGTFGINVKQDEQKHIPELIKYHRDWTYPANTVEPTTGVPSSAMSWAVSDRMDKDRFFREPGFIFGVSILRPKIFLGNQRGSAVGLLDTAESWLPAILGDQPWTALRKVAAGAGPLANQPATPGGDYWIDLGDLYRYGDQFSNVTLDGSVNGLPMPVNAGSGKDYVTSAGRNALFVTGETENKVRQDGVVDFTIKCSPTTAMDHT